MKAGLMLMGNHPPERSKFDAHRWDLAAIELGEELGFVEAWVGEHFASAWEPLPTAELLIAQAFQNTSNIKLGTGVYLLPFHHPVDLAHRAAYLDHLGQGRFMVGVGSGGLPTDVALFDIDYEAGQHREMFREALDIMLMLWRTDGPEEFRGKFWNVRAPGADEFSWARLRMNCKPFTLPHPPIAVAAGSPRSATLRMAGERGYIPLTLGLGAPYLASQWEVMEEGAAEAGRPPPSRSDWRIVRDVWIAETDAEARKQAREGMLWRAWEQYLYPFWSSGPHAIVKSMKHDESVPDDDVTLDYILDHSWLVGSPDTVAAKIRELYEFSGGFGVFLAMVLDHSDDPEGFRRSLTLLQTEVMPQLADLSI